MGDISVSVSQVFPPKDIGTFWNIFGAFLCILEHFGAFGAFWSNLEHSKKLWTLVELFGAFGAIWEHSGAIWNIYERFGAFGIIWEHIGGFWSILDYCLAFWSNFGDFGAILSEEKKRW